MAVLNVKFALRFLIRPAQACRGAACNDVMENVNEHLASVWFAES